MLCCILLWKNPFRNDNSNKWTTEAAVVAAQNMAIFTAYEIFCTSIRTKRISISFGTGVFKEACITMFNAREEQQQQQQQPSSLSFSGFSKRVSNFMTNISLPCHKHSSFVYVRAFPTLFWMHLPSFELLYFLWLPKLSSSCLCSQNNHARIHMANISSGCRHRSRSKSSRKSRRSRRSIGISWQWLLSYCLLQYNAI